MWWKGKLSSALAPPPLRSPSLLVTDLSHCGMNGVRQREDSDDEQKQKRQLTRQSAPQGPAHYASSQPLACFVRSSLPCLLVQDVYCIPSHTPPSPLLVSPTSHFQNAAFVVVNRSAGLQSGLGARFGLATTVEQPNLLIAVADPGFYLPRETSYDATKAVLLGWVEEERLGFFEQVVRSVELPKVDVPVSREWAPVARRSDCSSARRSSLFVFPLAAERRRGAAVALGGGAEAGIRGHLRKWGTAVGRHLAVSRGEPNCRRSERRG